MFVDYQKIAGCWEVIAWVAVLLHYNVRRFIILFYVRGDVKSWVR